MRQRWQPVAVMAVGLFLINVVARFVAWKMVSGTEKSQLRVGLIAMGIAAVVLIGAGYWWARRYPAGRVAADLGIAFGIGALLAVFVGPFVSGTTPGNVGSVIAVLAYYLVLCAAGVTFGVLIAMMLGRDYKSQAWKRYADTVRSRPRRPVRR